MLIETVTGYFVYGLLRAVCLTVCVKTKVGSILRSICFISQEFYSPGLGNYCVSVIGRLLLSGQFIEGNDASTVFSFSWSCCMVMPPSFFFYPCCFLQEYLQKSGSDVSCLTFFTWKPIFFLKAKVACLYGKEFSICIQQCFDLVLPSSETMFLLFLNCLNLLSFSKG